MATTKEDAIEYLNPKKKVRNEFCDQLSELIATFNNYEFSFKDDDQAFNDAFTKLVEISKNNKTGFVPYSSITSIVYDPQLQLDGFFAKFDDAISKSIENNVADNANIPDCYVMLIKASEHMKLADRQLQSLYRNQEAKIEEQKVKIKGQEQKVVGLINKAEKINKDLDEFEGAKDSLYGNFITILGIFSAIVFTLFGGLQSFSTAVTQITAKTNLWREGIILTIFGIILFCLMSFLMGSIAMITGKISINFDKQEHCWQRHPFWTILKILVVILIICIIGACLTHAF